MLTQSLLTQYLLDIQPGTTFFFNLQKEKHLWFILCITKESPIQIGVANFTTKDNRSDTSCILHVNDHPFLKHDTVVRYSAPCSVMEYSQFEELVRSDMIKLDPYPKISKSILSRILAGAGKSRQIKLKLKELLEREGLI